MRDRAMAMVVRDGRILMELVHLRGRSFWTIPGGGIEAGETPEAAAIRELREECGVDGRILRPLCSLYRPNGRTEHVFLAEIDDGQEPELGYDPEMAPDEQIIRGVAWKTMAELSPVDQAILWSYNAMDAGIQPPGLTGGAKHIKPEEAF